MKVTPYIIKQLKDWPIAKFYSNRAMMVDKLAQAAYERIQEESGHNLGAVLNETVYAEKLRVKSDPLKVDPKDEYAYWKKVESDLTSTVREDVDGAVINNELLQKLTKRYAEEIVGNFNVKTFGFAQKVLTFLFKSFYNKFYKSGQGLFWGGKEDLLDNIRIQGPLDHIRGLFEKGTVMVLPTHFSNLDSVLIGYGIDTLTGMPAFSYGAGLNLYDYELMAYYMSRLGAYKIDRRKKNPIYATTLRQFSTLTIEEGVNSIFFGGGTRSRNGAIEASLKLGLMNTLIDSQNAVSYTHLTLPTTPYV